jgi:hypothetical protein
MIKSGNLLIIDLKNPDMNSLLEILATQINMVKAHKDFIKNNERPSDEVIESRIAVLNQINTILNLVWKDGKNLYDLINDCIKTYNELKKQEAKTDESKSE